MKRLLLALLISLILALAGLGVVYGVDLPLNSLFKPLGVMQIAPFPNGLALYQSGAPYYYSLSPYNDYLVASDGARTALLTKEEIEANDIQTSLDKSHFGDLTRMVRNFFGAYQPELTFQTPNNKITYTAQVKDNKLVSTYTQAKKDSNFQSSGRVINYFGMDFIFDELGNLYSFQPEVDITHFNILYGLNLKLEENGSRVPVMGKNLLIVNPWIPAVMVIKAQPDQTLFVNRDARLIEAENPLPGNSLKIEVYPEVKEAWASL